MAVCLCDDGGMEREIAVPEVPEQSPSMSLFCHGFHSMSKSAKCGVVGLVGMNGESAKEPISSSDGTAVHHCL
jgi:hypothetical protein